MLNSSDNKQISSSSPSLYFREMRKLFSEGELRDILNTNYISKEAFEAGLNEDYEKFLEERSKTLSEQVKKLT